MVTRVAFTVIVIAVALQRLFEVRVSRRHEHALRMRGAVESAAWQMPFMVVLHTAWLASMVVEVWLLVPAFPPWMAVVACVVFAAGQTLRLLAMRALGSRWSVRVLTMPSADPVTRGIYRHVRHPNYLGVVLEIASLPLIGGAVWTAAVFSLANAVMLTARIRAEEAALMHDNAYGQHFGSHARFVPTSRRPRLPS
jgi:methyltransferase